jgi:hypothetical protein
LRPRTQIKAVGRSASLTFHEEKQIRNPKPEQNGKEYSTGFLFVESGVPAGRQNNEQRTRAKQIAESVAPPPDF